MTWLQTLVGLHFLIALGWVEATNRQMRNPYRRSRKYEIYHPLAPRNIRPTNRRPR